MSVLFTRFGGEPFVDAFPVDWTSQLDPTIQFARIEALATANYGRYAFRQDDSGAQIKGYSWDLPTTIGEDLTDVDQLTLWQSTDVLSSQTLAILWARFSGVFGSSEDGYYLTCRLNDDLRIGKYNAGAFSTVAEISTSLTWTQNTWYWLHFRVEGSTLYGKVWEYGTAPPAWMLIATDTDHTAAGWNGIGNATDRNFYFDYYSIATEGDSAILADNAYGAVAPNTDNTLQAFPSTIQTDATSFLVYSGKPNVAVDWALTGDGTLTPLTDYTDDAGKAWAKYTPGTIGTKTIDVTVGVL